MSLYGIDVGLFIDEVRKHPVIWDLNCEQKNNRQVTNQVWMEISRNFVEDYDQLERSAKIEIARRIQSRWRNLRDTYVRVNKKKNSKRYIYSKHMTFLDPIYNFANSSPKENDSDKDVKTIKKSSKKTKGRVKRKYTDDDEEDIYFDVQLSKEPKIEPKERPTITHQDLEFVAASPRIRSDVNDDASFFESLMPIVKQFDMDQKLAFRTDVLNLVTRIRMQDPFNTFKQTVVGEAYCDDDE